MGTAIQIEMALDQAKRFEDELQLLFMQAGKIDVWNKIKSRSQAMDVEAAHDARRTKEAEAKRKKKEQEQLEILFAVVFIIFVMAGLAIGLYELVEYCRKYGCN